jgi:hypothetical protein
MSKQLLKFGAAVEGVSTRKDKTLTIRLGTQELPGETAGQLFGMQNAFVYVALKEEDFGRDEIEALEALEADAIEDHRKTQSQRLRAVLFLNWKYDNKGCKTFAMYYDMEMERIIEHFKKKLP